MTKCEQSVFMVKTVTRNITIQTYPLSSMARDEKSVISPFQKNEIRISFWKRACKRLHFAKISGQQRLDLPVGEKTRQ